MTEEKFLEIIDSSSCHGDDDDKIIEKYQDDPDFIKFAKKFNDDFNKEKEDQRRDFQKRESNINEAISELLERNKDVSPEIKTLSVKSEDDDNDFYEDTLDEFKDDEHTQSINGNILICLYDNNNLRLKVKGMYKNTEVTNFGNEVTFVSDGESINLIAGSGRFTPGHKDLIEFLKYLDGDLLNPAMEIDHNLFNTEADYFVLVE